MQPRALTLVALTIPGCSLALDTDATQCAHDGQCVSPYVCDAQAHICVQPRCAHDGDCNAGICEDGRCDKPACAASIDCDDDRVCDPTGRCVVPACRTASECSASPTVACVDGTCVDTTWGCIGAADDRPAPSASPATYVVEVLDVLSREVIEGMSVKVCSALDARCAQPLTTPQVSIDGGRVTVTALPQDAALHLMVSAPGFFDTHFYPQRLVRDVTTEPQPILLIPPSIVPVLSQEAGVTVNTVDNGTLIARIFDCGARPAKGVTLDVSEPLATTEVFYVDEKNLPNPDFQSTSSYGAAGVANLKADSQVTFTFRAGEAPLSTVTLVPYAGVMTYVNVYPRAYAPQP